MLDKFKILFAAGLFLIGLGVDAAIGQVLDAFNPDVNGNVNVVVVHLMEILIGGSFTSVAGVTATGSRDSIRTVRSIPLSTRTQMALWIRSPCSRTARSVAVGISPRSEG